MAQATTLRQFSADELLLDEEESRIIIQVLLSRSIRCSDRHHAYR